MNYIYYQEDHLYDKIQIDMVFSMNRIVFFSDSHLERKGGVIDFLLDKFPSIWVSSAEETKEIESIDELSKESGYWHRKHWLISGSCPQKEKQEFVEDWFLQKEPEFNISLEEIESKIDFLAKKYEWLLFSWGGISPFSAFGFLSSDRSISEQVASLYSYRNKSNSLISNYTFDTLNFTHSIHSVLMGGYHASAYPLWDIRGSDSETLWMVTDLVISDDFSVFDWWTPSGYKLVEHLYAEASPQENLYIYEISTEESFRSMCLLSSQEPRTLVFVPSNTNLLALRRLFCETEKHNGFPDLVLLEEILRNSEWFLGLDRDRADYGYSLLVARDNKIIRRFSAASQKYDFRVMACF